MSYLSRLQTRSSQSRTYLSLALAGLLTLLALSVWLATLASRLSQSSTLSASNEEQGNTLFASQSIEERLNELGASFDVFRESAGILSGGGEENTSEVPAEGSEEISADGSEI